MGGDNKEGLFVLFAVSRDSLSALMLSATPLLTPRQELLYARQVQAGLVDGATAKEERIGKRARNRIITSNLKLVMKVALKYQPIIKGNAAIELGDLVQEGCIGLVRAVEKFDPSRGYKFSTYSYWWVRQAIAGVLQKQLSAIKVSAECSLTATRWKNKPTGQSLEVFAAEWKTTPEKVLAAVERHKRSHVSSLDCPVQNSGESEKTDLMSTIASEEVYDIEERDFRDAVNDLRNHEEAVVRDAVALFELAETATTAELNELVGGYNGAARRELNRMTEVINNVVPIHIKERLHA